ncbi:hypothetical protein MEA186_23396 [Mesorhizobium amorphae CCNWGS0123]|uniref:Uncharacterized protein n=1 Tax=Mesorhizobium amorphae CCNWGS0123 TaxID=1082933 RepID=G6YFD2_9HYPH|nr:hypothetical protein A6B35_25485 [Mesorhizobium amorphae CCNWGS0123]EHH09520.1 hypothetical protein MEA186_23396 [Mesorhizobium amorphae CCNWGS0123]
MLAEFTKALTTHDVECEIVRALTHDIKPLLTWIRERLPMMTAMGMRRRFFSGRARRTGCAEVLMQPMS